MKQPALKNAQAFARQYPIQVSAPSQEELDALQVGMCVKVGVGDTFKNSEAFWAEVHEITPTHIVGVIVNELRFTETHGLKALDVIQITRDNVFIITD
ncbi:MAG: hypothetical protein RSD49_04860 [Hafnia sp.]